MRIFAITTIATVVLGFSTIFAMADEVAPQTALTPNGHVLTAPDPATSQYVKLDRALQRLELEAQLEDFYAEKRAQAEGLDEAGRLALYRDAERQLHRLVLGSETYAGEHLGKGVDYLQLARVVLAQQLGFENVPT